MNTGSSTYSNPAYRTAFQGRLFPYYFVTREQVQIAGSDEDRVARAVMEVKYDGDIAFTATIRLQWADLKPNTTKYIGGLKNTAVVATLEFDIDPKTRKFYLGWFLNHLSPESDRPAPASLVPFAPYMKGMTTWFLRVIVRQCVAAGLVDENSVMYLTALPLKDMYKIHERTVDEMLPKFERLTGHYQTLGFQIEKSDDMRTQVDAVIRARKEGDQKSPYHTGIPMTTTIGRFLQVTDRSKRKLRTSVATLWRSMSEYVAQNHPEEEPQIKEEIIDKLTAAEVSIRQLHSKLHQYVKWRREHPGMPNTTDDYLTVQQEVNAIHHSLKRHAINERGLLRPEDYVKWNEAFTAVDYEPDIDETQLDDPPMSFNREEIQVVRLEPDYDDDGSIGQRYDDDDDDNGRRVEVIPPPQFRVDDDEVSSSSSSSSIIAPAPAASQHYDPKSPIFSSRSPQPPTASAVPSRPKKRPFIDLTADSDDDVDDKKVKWTE